MIGTPANGQCARPVICDLVPFRTLDLLCRTMTLETTDTDIQQPPPLRENVVNTAVAFLRNPAVQKTPQSRQEAFLKRKGLTDEEVTIAFQRASTYQDGYYAQQIPPPPSSLMVPALLPPSTPWSRFRDIGNTVALLTGLLYAMHMLYKRYVERYLFKTVRKKSNEELLIELKIDLLKSVDDLKCDLGRVSAELSNVKQQQNLTSQSVDVSDDLRNLKQEVASLKALLLSRNQFPTAVVNSPSIPAWQLQSQEEKASGESGSGSSEPELVAKNGSSDSSVDVLHD